MTHKEAIDFINNEIQIDVRFCNDEKVRKTIEVLEMATSALEKQRPKKPTHEATLFRCTTCPNCKNVIDEFVEFIPGQPKIKIKTAHCKFCGQALDWSDTK